MGQHTTHRPSEQKIPEISRIMIQRRRQEFLQRRAVHRDKGKNPPVADRRGSQLARVQGAT
jgi:hypothetical protein